jgi:hypothetical protein
MNDIKDNEIKIVGTKEITQIKPRGYLEDGDGNKSVMRVVYAFIMITLTTVWAVISLWTRALQPMDSGFIMIMIGLSGTKVAQSMVEGGKMSLNIGGKKENVNG